MIQSLKLPQQQVDWSQHHIEGKDLQPEVVAEKFKLWDYVVDNDLLNSPDPKVRNAATLLLDDDTIYEYAFFKNDEDKPFQYEAYQDLIAQCRYDFKDWNDPNRFVMFVASNQIGKTRFLVGKARKLLFSETGRNIVIVTNNLKLTQFVLNEIKASLANSTFANSWKEDIDDVNNTTMLTIKVEVNGVMKTNRLICTPATEGSLGYPIHYLFLDELDFYENGRRLFWKVFFPRLNKTKGQCFVFSNPNPDIPKSESVLYELWESKEYFERKFRFMFLDASWNTQEEFDKAKRNSPEHIFRSTHMGEWSDNAGSFFSHAEIQAMLNKDWRLDRLPVTQNQVYIGVDLGKMKDQTVIVVGVAKDPKNSLDKYKDLDVIYTEELPLKTPYDQIAQRIDAIKEHFDGQGGVAEIGFDATGQKTFEDFLKRMNLQATPVDFSRKESNKTQLYNDFKLMAENRKIKVAYSAKCEKQLSALEFKLTETKRLKVENRSDDVHDDFPDALAILIHIAVKPSKIGVSATIVGNKKEKDINEKDLNGSRGDQVDAYIAQVVRSNNSFNRYRRW